MLITWLRWILWNHDPIGVASKTSSKRQITTMSTHDLHDKASLMTGSRCHNGIDSLDDPMQSRIGTDGHVGAAKVIVNRADKSHDVEMRALVALLLRDLFRGDEFVEQRRPLLLEHVRACQTTVAANTHEIAYARFDKILGCLATTGSFAKVRTSSATNGGSTLLLSNAKS